MSISYNFPAIRKLLLNAFNVAELETFCFEYFPEVMREFAPSMTLSRRIFLLLTYCYEHEQFSYLLEKLAIERPRAYEQLIEEIITPDKNGRFNNTLDDHYSKPRQGTRLLIGLSILIIIAMISALYFLNRIEPMPEGEFNVGVASFSVVDNENQLSNNFSEKLSEAVYKRIEEASLEQSPERRPNLRPPDEIGQVEGEDDESRALYALDLAELHNTTLMVYGIISPNAEMAELNLYFYVNPNNAPGFSYGDEIVGPGRLGTAILFDPALPPAELLELSLELKSRVDALAGIVKGLDDYFYGDYELAAGEFRRATRIDWQHDIEAIGEETGKEVIYLLLGAAKLRAYDPISAQNLLIEAQNAFTQAQQINPEYGRSYLGLGATLLEEAKIVDEKGAIIGVNEEKLTSAAAEFEKALVANDQPITAFVPTKANFGLAQIHLLGFEHQLAGWSALEAERLYNEIIENDVLTNENPRDLVWFVAHSLAQNGRLAAHLRQDWATMHTNVDQAITKLETLPGRASEIWIARYHTWIALAEKRQGHCDEAREAYRQAINLGTSLIEREELDSWQSALEQVGEGENCDDI